ncbi:MAG: SLATT domain-containing protein [Rhizomicrobium sp.]
MTSAPVEAIKTTIWFTSHCRIFAEKRYRKYNNISHLSLSWLSLAAITCAVTRCQLQTSTFVDTYTAVLSTFVFAFSIIVFGFRFGETAVLFRECYLRLQKLHDSNLDPEAMTSAYHEILGAYGNHDDWDYESLVIRKTYLEKEELHHKDGSKVIWTRPMLAKHFLLSGAFWAVVVVLFLLGSVPYVLLFSNLK